MDELSDEIRDGFRRMEDKIRAIETPSQSKRAVRYLPINNPCPKDFLPVDVGKLQSCYLLSNFNTTWYEAKSYCTALGSHLVAFGSIREHYVLTYMIKNHPGKNLITVNPSYLKLSIWSFLPPSYFWNDRSYNGSTNRLEYDRQEFLKGIQWQKTHTNRT